MAERIETFDVTIAAGTAIAVPATTSLPFDRGIVERLEIIVPPGPSGLVGFRIQHSGNQVIPRRAGSWIVADDEAIKWELQGYPVGSAWSLVGYNTDVFAHTLYLRFLINETRVAVTSRAALVPLAPQAIAEDYAPSA